MNKVMCQTKVNRMGKREIYLSYLIVSVIFLGLLTTTDALGGVVCTEPPSDLVSWWPGDGNAFDIQDANDGTLQGNTTFAAGKVDQAFSFDGVDDDVAIPNNAALNPGTGSFTVDAWVRTGSSGNHVVFAKDGSGDDALVALQLIVQNGKLAAFLRDLDGPATGQAIVGTSTVADGSFHHVALVRDMDASEMRIYLDGVVEASQALNSGSNGDITNNEPAFIGSTAGLAEFLGVIDEVEYFSRALSTAEILAIHDSGSAGKCRTCTPPPSDMVSWWRAENNPNDTQDGNDGTLQGNATFAAGKVGQSFSFDGDGDFVNVPLSTNLNIQNAITIDAWVKPSTITDIKVIAGKPFGYQIILLADGKARFAFPIGGPFSSVDSTSAIPINTFTHVAATYDSSTGMIKMYINGVLENTVTTSGTIDIVNKPFQIGGFSDIDFTGAFFHGLIDEVEVFNRALSQSEIQEIVNAGSAGKCKEGCSAGFWGGHTGEWEGHTTGDMLSSDFTIPSCLNTCSFESKTLLNALKFKGGSTICGAAQILLRQGVAALLNASHSGILYNLTDSDVMNDVDDALATCNRSDILEEKSELEALNILGCPLK